MTRPAQFLRAYQSLLNEMGLEINIGGFQSMLCKAGALEVRFDLASPPSFCHSRWFAICCVTDGGLHSEWIALHLSTSRFTKSSSQCIALVYILK